jgi:hypothetical protein
MHTSPHQRIAMAIEMAMKGRVFFDIVDVVFVHNHRLRTMLFSIKIKTSHAIVLYIVWAAAGNNGCHFGHHCCQPVSLIS